MTENNSITYYMLEDHKKIDAKLEKILDGYGLDKTDIQRLLTQFVDDMEKHMSAEERAIFGLNDFGGADVANIISELLTDHAQIRNLLKQLQEEAKDGYPRGFGGFVELLKYHTKVENETLYPRLDKKLGEMQREKIVSKIKKIR